jgi:hypothetical protein
MPMLSLLWSVDRYGFKTRSIIFLWFLSWNYKLHIVIKTKWQENTNIKKFYVWITKTLNSFNWLKGIRDNTLAFSLCAFYTRMAFLSLEFNTQAASDFSNLSMRLNLRGKQDIVYYKEYIFLYMYIYISIWNINKWNKKKLLYTSFFNCCHFIELYFFFPNF